MLRPLAAAFLALLPLAGVGCTQMTIHGVEVHNETDRIVRVELLQLNKTGEMTAYSTQTLGPGADFKNKYDAEDRKRGMRIRFMLADQDPAANNWVMLNIPDNRDREYDLTLVNSRLSARELSKNRKLNHKDWTNPD